MSLSDSLNYAVGSRRLISNSAEGSAVAERNSAVARTHSDIQLGRLQGTDRRDRLDNLTYEGQNQETTHTPGSRLLVASANPTTK
jgi:hypothetical protein